MAKPSKFVSLALPELLSKYNGENWAQKLKGFELRKTERKWNASGPKSTVRKCNFMYFDGDGDPVTHVIVYTRADGSEDFVVLFIVDGETDYHSYS